MTKLISNSIPQEIIEIKILLIRGHKVMLAKDLAILYGVSTKRLNEQVKRNIKRFPPDFLLKLSWEEMKSLRSHFATLKRGQHEKYRSYAFTENGVAMLSSVLKSERAIEVNIQIMRVFTRIRKLMVKHQDLQKRIDKMEQQYDKQIMTIFQVLKQLTDKSKEELKLHHPIGFRKD